jgi:hypothetical protein
LCFQGCWSFSGAPLTIAGSVLRVDTSGSMDVAMVPKTSVWFQSLTFASQRVGSREPTLDDPFPESWTIQK